MDSKTTSFKPVSARPHHAFALAELLVAVGLASLLFVMISAFAMFCSRSFAALYNYVDLDDINRVAVDQLTRDVRQANRVTAFNTNGMSLTLEDGVGASITYTYNANARTFTRTYTGSTSTESKVLLKECDRLQFHIGQRNTKDGGYDFYDTGSLDLAKVVNVSWLCSRSLFGRKENTESVQTAVIVIRKQGT